MSINNLPHILIRKCEERKGIRITERYLESWCSKRQLSSDMESEYTALVADFLNTEMALTSKPVISDEISKASFNTFPPGNFRRGVVLEIVDVDDTSNSAMSILESLTNTIHVRRGVVTNEDQPEIQRGTLHWILSDGTTHIHALEEETIPELKLTTPFGCKIMIKNCQVRRGMLLLDRKSVTVLGGETPEAFNNNMTEELISRLRARLGITSEGQSSATNTAHNTPTNNRLDGSTLVNTSASATDLDDDFDDMDMNDDMFHALESMEAVALRNGNSNNDPDEFMDDDWDPDLLESVFSATIPPNNISTPNGNINGVNGVNGSSIRSNYKRPISIDDEPESLPSSQTQPESKRQRISAVKPDQVEDLLWGDDDDDDDDVLENGIQVIEDNKEERWPLDKLNDILRKMEKDEPVGSLPDTVIINGTIKKLGQLRLTSRQGFYLVGYLKNPMDEKDERLRILFRNKIVTELLDGVSHEEIMQKSLTSDGKKRVLKETIAPLQQKLRTKEADIEVDLSLCERDNESVLMPLVVSYTPTH